MDFEICFYFLGINFIYLEVPVGFGSFKLIICLPKVKAGNTSTR